MAYFKKIKKENNSQLVKILEHIYFSKRKITELLSQKSLFLRIIIKKIGFFENKCLISGN